MLLQRGFIITRISIRSKIKLREYAIPIIILTFKHGFCNIVVGPSLLRNIVRKAIFIFFTCLFYTSFSYSLLAEQGFYPAGKQLGMDSLGLDSLNTRFLGNWPFGCPYHVAYDSSRNVAFLSSGGGVFIIDTSNPANPVKMSESIHSREYILWELFYDGSTQRLYIGVARWYEVWDVSNPYAPTRLSYFSLTGPGYADGTICASGNYAYCADDSVFAIVDVSMPTDPQIISELPIPARSIAIKDSFAYLLQSAPVGFHVIDISDPYNPAEVSFLSQRGGDIAIHGSRAYISSDLQGLKFRIVDISDPYNPYFCGFFDSPGDVYHAHVIDTIAYLATNSGLRIVNIADPMDSQEIGNFSCGGMDIFVKDTLSFVVGRYTGLRIFDISSPSSPQEIGQFITPGRSFASRVSGAFAYIANEKGLWIIDVSDPVNSREVGRCYTPHRIYDIRVSGSFAYAVSCSTGFFVFDISDPSNPYIVGSLSPPEWYCPEHVGFELSGHHAYITDGYHGLWIIDISNPSSPYVAGVCSLSHVIDVAVLGIYAYAATYDHLVAIDISNPSNPEIVASVTGHYFPSDICISGMYAFVTDSCWGNDKMCIYDISEIPPLCIAYRNQSLPTGIHISGSYAFIPGLYCYFWIWDISQPSNPVYSGHYYSYVYNFQFYGIFSMGTYVYVTSDLGLQIYQFYGAGIEEELAETTPKSSSIRLIQNPVTTNSIKLMLIISNPDNCTMCLYNILGQEVKTFDLENLAVGKNRVELPTDQISNGIYFLRMKNGPDIQSEKVVILR